MENIVTQDKIVVNERNKEIDYLRSYAIILVLFAHVVSYLYYITHNHDWSLDGYGWDSGVDLFFVISGFVVSDSFHRLSQKEKRKPILFLEFYFKRFIRLWPAAAFWLLFNVVASYALAKQGLFPPFDDVVRKFFYGIVYLSNVEEIGNHTSLGYFWSLSLEWQSYLVIPFLFLVRRRARMCIIIASIIITSMYRVGGESWWMFRFDGILFGVLMYDLHKAYGEKIHIDLKLNFLASAIITIALIYAILSSIKITDSVYFSITLRCLFSSALLLLAVMNKNLISDLGLGRLFTWIGLRSYSIYLCHLPAMYCAISFAREIGMSMTFIPILSLSIVLCFVFSELSYKLLESIKVKF